MDNRLIERLRGGDESPIDLPFFQLLPETLKYFLVGNNSGLRT